MASHVPPDAPTPSPTINAIIDLCVKLKDDQPVQAEAREAATRALAELERARGMFNDNLKRAGEAHLKTCGDQIERVSAAYKQHRESLEDLLAYLDHGGPEVLERAVYGLRASTLAMINALQGYQTAEISAGPTDIPYMNVLLQAFNAVRDGRVAVSIFGDMVKAATRNFQVAVAEIADARPGAALERLKLGYQAHIAGLEQLAGALEARELDKASTLLGEMTVQARELKQAMEAYSEERITAGPTPSPFANILINVIEALKEGRIKEAVFIDALEKFTANLNALKTEMRSLAATPTDSEFIKDELVRAEAALALHDAALADIRLFIEDRNVYLLDRGVEKLADAAAALHVSYEALRSFSEREGRITCLHCHHPNPIQSRNCEKCGAVMIRPPDAAAASTFQISEDGGALPPAGFIMTENLARLFEAVNQVEQGAIPDREFLAVVEWLRGMVAGQEARIQGVPGLKTEGVPAAQKQMIEEIGGELEKNRDLFLEGTRILSRGLEILQEYVHDHDRDHLIEGVRVVRTGVEKLQQSERGGRELGQVAETLKQGIPAPNK